MRKLTPTLHTKRAVGRVAPSTSADTSRADLKSFTEADGHVSSNPHVHRTPATDSRRSADPTSRMGPAKWRIPPVRFLRSAPYGTAQHFDAKQIQRIVRCCPPPARTGTKLNRHRGDPHQRRKPRSPLASRIARLVTFPLANAALWLQLGRANK